MLHMDRKNYTAGVDRKNLLERRIAEILAKTENIHFAYIFGSFTDEDMPFHDIDLGVFYAGKNQLRMSEAAIELAATLSRTAGCPVDVRVLNHAPVSFIYNVFKGKLIHENDEDIRCRIMESTVRQYLDMKPILHLATKEAFSNESQS